MPEMPEWVHVWFWMRFLRDPQDMTPFPQQGLDPEAMSTREYEERKSEWLKVGGAKTSAKKVLAAMAGVVVEPEDDIPF